MAEAFLGLGSNLGNRRANLRAALIRLAPPVRLVAVSRLYQSEPLAAPGIDKQPAFLNAVARVETSLSPDELLELVKRVEWSLGRRRGIRWGPRPIDIDILLYDDLRLKSDRLTIPHPAIRERSFVLAPLADLAGEFKPPGWDGDVRAALARLGLVGVERLAGVDWAGAPPNDG